MRTLVTTPNLLRQRGAATLITSLVLLVTMTIVTIFVARSIVMEQRIYSNEYRSKQAFEAAEAGLDYGLKFVLDYGVDRDKDDVLDTVMSAVTTLPNGSDYMVTLSEINPPGDMTRIRVTSTGRSDDDTSIRKVSQVIGLLPAFPSVPGNPMTTKGSVVINGAGEVINPEGNATIWTGSNSVTFSGASGKTSIPDPSNPGQLIDSSNSTVTGLDIVMNDTNLSSMTDDQFFKNFLGVDKNTYQNGYATLAVDGANVNNAWNDASPGTDLARREIIWVDGDSDFSGNTTVGCTATVAGNTPTTEANCIAAGGQVKPVIMVIDGNLQGSGTVKVFGLVYITGDFQGSGNLDVTGAVIMEGGVTGSGALDVRYSSSVLKQAGDTLGPPATIAGTWRDFSN